MRLGLLDVLHQADPVAVGQLHVCQAKIGLNLIDQRLCLCQRGGRTRGESHPPNGDIKQLPDIRFVVDDEYGLLGHRALVSQLVRWLTAIRKQLSPFTVIL